MKSLATLIKLQKTRVDEQRLLLAKLQSQLNDILEGIKALKDDQMRQQEALRHDMSMAFTFDAYLKDSLKRLEVLEKRRKTAEYAVALAREKMAELFEEQKRYELAEQARIEEQEAQEQRRETHALDEVGSIGFIRKKRRSRG